MSCWAKESHASGQAGSCPNAAARSSGQRKPRPSCFASRRHSLAILAQLARRRAVSGDCCISASALLPDLAPVRYALNGVSVSVHRTRPPGARRVQSERGFDDRDRVVVAVSNRRGLIHRLHSDETLSRVRLSNRLHEDKPKTASGRCDRSRSVTAENHSCRFDLVHWEPRRST